jgi:hypothetical protein
MAESRERYLDKYRDEIITLIRDKRYTQARARNALEQKYGLDIPHSTFGAYCKRIPELKETPQSVSPEAEHFVEQYQVYQTIIDGIKTTSDLGANLHGHMGVPEDATAERHKALVAGIQQLSHELTAGIQERHEVTVRALQRIADMLSALQANTQGLETPDTHPALNAIQESLKGYVRDTCKNRSQEHC